MQIDIILQRDVLAAIDHDEGVIPGTIGVELHHGVVKLAGRVNTGMIRQRAEGVVRSVSGVSTVLMDIDVVNPGDTHRL